MKTIIFDFDGTLTKKNNEIWRNIWQDLDALDIDDILYNKFNNGELDYEGWCKEIEKVFVNKKLHTKTLDNLINNIEMMDNLEETLKELKRRNYHLCILSGGIDYVIKSLLKDNIKYFDDIKSNVFTFNNDGYLTSIEQKDSDEEGKARYITNYIKTNKCKPSDIIFIGNGHNDRFVSSSGCHTICLNPNNTNHKDKSTWSHYIEKTSNLYDIIKVIDSIKKIIR